MRAESVDARGRETLADNVENLTLTGSAALAGTGNALDNTLTGGIGNDTLIGGAGNDTLIGWAGNDTYIIDNAGDVVTEAANAGTDTVQASVSYTLSDNVEALVLTGTGAINGTGNALANTLTGNGGDNTLDGGAGADTLIGGTGNDTYIIDNASDVVTEAANAGTDTVQASISCFLGTNLENLILAGASNIDGTGNALSNIIVGNSGVNMLDGGSGNDTLDGGAGADILIGGAGDDIYVVDNAGDVVVEIANGGADTVQSSVSFILTVDVENLTLTDTGNISGTGNSLANILTGNSNDNTLDGGAGADTLIGGTGNDTLRGGSDADRFVFNTRMEGKDTITDFEVGTDKIMINSPNFGSVLPDPGASSQVLSSLNFVANASGSASNVNQVFLFNTTTCTLFFDADGSGSGSSAVAVATLTGVTNLSSNDIQLFGIGGPGS
ncbi:serralysin [uncultured Gammaproteobacteria bacterium]